jgi:pyridoxamine 5'-phosphate oxidase-like protein
MANWSEFEAAAPEMAEEARRLMYRNGEGEALLVTVRGNEPPRIHPVNAGIVDGHLYTFVQAASAKRRDLEQDGRYALHTHVDPTAPSEFMVRGHARLVEDEATRTAVASDWFFKVDRSYPLYELLVEHALLGERATANDWPPMYSSWPKPRPARP